MADRSSHPPTGHEADGGPGALAIGVVCGMVAEVRTLGHWARDPRIAVAVSGAQPDRAEAAARRLVSEGARALLSWGIAGALDPALGPGALIVPRRVLRPDGVLDELATGLLDRPGFCAADGLRIETWPTTGDAGRGRRLAPSGGRNGEVAARRSEPGATYPDVAWMLLAGSDTLVLDPAAKAALRRRTGAAAVDMESHRVARVAAEAGLPCYVVRAVSDPAVRALPALAATALGPDGRPRLGPVLTGLLRRPGDLPALLRAARDSRVALATLRRAAAPLIAALLAVVPRGR